MNIQENEYMVVIINLKQQIDLYEKLESCYEERIKTLEQQNKLQAEVIKKQELLLQLKNSIYKLRNEVF